MRINADVSGSNVNEIIERLQQIIVMLQYGEIESQGEELSFYLDSEEKE